MFKSRQWIGEDGKKDFSHERPFSFSTYYLLEGRLPWTPVASLFASPVLFDSWKGHEYQSVPVARERTAKYYPHGIALDIARTRTLFILRYTRHCVLCNISFPGTRLAWRQRPRWYASWEVTRRQFLKWKIGPWFDMYWCRYHVVRRVTNRSPLVLLHYTKKKPYMWCAPVDLHMEFHRTLPHNDDA